MTVKERQTWKVGEVAKATGVTVRALHHYEEIGLLVPSSRSESGHRVYSKGDLQKLQQILSLKQLGFPLEEIDKCLHQKALSPLEIVRLHRERVLANRDHLDKLNNQLMALEQTLATCHQPSIDELFKTMEVITMHDKYFTKEQLDEIKTRNDLMGEEKMKGYQEAWTELFEKVRAEMRKGTDPATPQVQKLAAEWNSLVKAFTGGNAQIEVQLGSMYRNEPTMRQKAGMEPELWEYAAKMMAYLHKQRA